MIRNDRAAVDLRCALTYTGQPSTYLTLSSRRFDNGQKALLHGGMGAPSKIGRVTIKKWDNSANPTTDEGTFLRTTATVSGLYGNIFADTTGITLSASTSNYVTSVASTGLLVGFGGSSDSFATEIQIFDRSVY